MIINIRGTNGSGKSTLARAIMDRYDSYQPMFVAGRKQPVGYTCWRNPHRSLYVVGHYETPCGGADTITTPDDVYDAVKRRSEHEDVLYEGIITQDDVKRCAEVSKRHYTLVVALRVPIEDCLAAVQARRDARGDKRPFDPENTINRAKTLERTVQRLIEAKVDARWLSREDALALCVQMLGLPSASKRNTRSPSYSGQWGLDFSE